MAEQKNSYWVTRVGKNIMMAAAFLPINNHEPPPERADNIPNYFNVKDTEIPASEKEDKIKIPAKAVEVNLSKKADYRMFIDSEIMPQDNGINLIWVSLYVIKHNETVKKDLFYEFIKNGKIVNIDGNESFYLDGVPAMELRLYDSRAGKPFLNIKPAESAPEINRQVAEVLSKAEPDLPYLSSIMEILNQKPRITYKLSRLSEYFMRWGEMEMDKDGKATGKVTNIDAIFYREFGDLAQIINGQKKIAVKDSYIGFTVNLKLDMAIELYAKVDKETAIKTKVAFEDFKEIINKHGEHFLDDNNMLDPSKSPAARLKAAATIMENNPSDYKQALKKLYPVNEVLKDLRGFIKNHGAFAQQQLAKPENKSLRENTKLLMEIFTGFDEQFSGVYGNLQLLEKNSTAIQVGHIR